MPRMPEAHIAITAGEPGGIGPDLITLLSERKWPARCVVFADPALLTRRADSLGRSLQWVPFDAHSDAPPPGALEIWPIAMPHAEQTGYADPALAPYVLECIHAAGQACLDGPIDALVTGPVQKSSLLDAGIRFQGHTEFLAEQAGVDSLMLLIAQTLRVALATTHLPLSEVPGQLRTDRLIRSLELLIDGLRHHFAIACPHIRVLGLNPHAGEGGHLGQEERTIIAPAIEHFQSRNCHLEGPVSADTAFVERDGVDAFLAMYHDQGLPVLKTLGFSQSVNVTLGLPYVRTSVDHGTALDRAGTGQANPGSLFAAIDSAIEQVQATREARAAA